MLSNYVRYVSRLLPTGLTQYIGAMPLFPEILDYDDNHQSYAPRNATFLQDVFPHNSVLFTVTRRSNSIQDSYMGWTIVALCPEFLDKKQWTQLWKSVDARIRLGYNSYGGDGVDVIEAGKESAALADFDSVLRASDYTQKGGDGQHRKP